MSDSDMLRLMAEHSGHLERGGLAIREASVHCTGGDVIGRTAWVGQPQWAQGLGLNRAQLKRAVERHLAGKRLGILQRTAIEAMQAELIDMKLERNSPAFAGLSRPAQLGKAAQHFPARDRPRQAKKGHNMNEAKPKVKRPRGRPSLGIAKRIMVSLDAASVARAKALSASGKNLSEGIRKALKCPSYPLDPAGDAE